MWAQFLVLTVGAPFEPFRGDGLSAAEGRQRTHSRPSSTSRRAAIRMVCWQKERLSYWYALVVVLSGAFVRVVATKERR